MTWLRAENVESDMFTNLHRHWMMVVCFACCIMAAPITADAQPQIIVSSYTSTWMDLDVTPNKQIFYAEIFDQSNPYPYYHADHYSWAYLYSGSGTYVAEGAGGGPYWLEEEAEVDVEAEFTLMTFMRLFCSGLQAYTTAAPPQEEGTRRPFRYRYTDPIYIGPGDWQFFRYNWWTAACKPEVIHYPVSNGDVAFKGYKLVLGPYSHCSGSCSHPWLASGGDAETELAGSSNENLTCPPPGSGQ
jgi:hypothetical protein